MSEVRSGPGEWEGEAEGPATSRRWGLAAWWGLLGVAALFAVAVWRLAGRGLETIGAGLGPLEWLALAALTALFVYTEGIRALERRWVPQMMRRIRELEGPRGRRHGLLAPLYAMSLVGAPRRTLALSWGGAAAILLAVLIVRALPEPWRGITDLAVAAALAWGLAAIVAAARRARREP